jgi:acyl-CoA thioester hydrolase
MKNNASKRKKAFHYDVPVVWSDLDAKGHVSNLMFPVYLESARAVYYLGLLGTKDPMRIDFILARFEIDFESPAFYDDTLQVWIRPGKVGKTSFEFEYMVTKKGSGKLIASARSVQVCLDYRNRKKRPVPRRLARMLKGDALCPFPEVR